MHIFPYVNRIFIAVVFFFAIMPTTALAQFGPNESPDTISVLNIFLGIFDVLIVVLTALALVYFIWGVVKFIGAQDNETARTAARAQMIHGIIALFVIVSVWGLVNVLGDTFNLREEAPPLPKIPGRGTQFDFP